MHELTELTAGAPSSARAVLEAAGLSAEKLRPLCKLRQFRSVLSLLLTVATFLGVPLLAWLFPHPAGMCSVCFWPSTILTALPNSSMLVITGRSPAANV